MASISEVHDDIRRSVDKVCSGEVSNPDWISILELCDQVSSSQTQYDPFSLSHRPLIQRCSAEETVRSLQRVLSDYNNPESRISLALLVTESILNNCPGFYNHIATLDFLQEMVALADRHTPDVQGRATRMLQDWATNFTDCPIFRDTYNQLKSQGVAFPSGGGAATQSSHGDNGFATIPLSGGGDAYYDEKPAGIPAPAPSASHGGTAAEFEKLRRDLISVEEKIKTYYNMRTLHIGGEDAEDALDFLQQCQPRMNALIEAGLAGKLDEQTLETCLTVNDHLINVLEGKAPSSMDETLIESKAPYHPSASNEPDYLAGPMAHLSITPAPQFTHSDAV
ncbi:Aste57867_10855 [Aphanomyces stellatus]|uniref:Aste57867_10855 protein n=1 Tax=Aphanomyces stellatus TaxID=120398 RepID=A0A485KRW3_9STRA|nr:hypothetical protein As57867_010815 [Aphanomyces stellatus]VFT87723.1 Aste57867_10855 [Aphanomyces stellatus]